MNMFDDSQLYMNLFSPGRNTLPFLYNSSESGSALRKSVPRYKIIDFHDSRLPRPAGGGVFFLPVTESAFFLPKERKHIHMKHFSSGRPRNDPSKRNAPRPHFGMDIEETQGIIRVWANFEVIPEPLWSPGGPASEALRLISGKIYS